MQLVPARSKQKRLQEDVQVAGPHFQVVQEEERVHQGLRMRVIALDVPLGNSAPCSKIL
jgi:hypothetical protein